LLEFRSTGADRDYRVDVPEAELVTEPHGFPASVMAITELAIAFPLERTAEAISLEAIA
jgi:hypothetical protein